MKSYFCQGMFLLLSLLFSVHAYSECKGEQKFEKLKNPIVIKVPRTAVQDTPVFDGPSKQNIPAENRCEPIDYISVGQNIIMYEKTNQKTEEEFYKIAYLDKQTNEVKFGVLREKNTNANGRVRTMEKWYGYLSSHNQSTWRDILLNSPEPLVQYIFTKDTKISAQGYSPNKNDLYHHFVKGNTVWSMSTSKNIANKAHHYGYENNGKEFFFLYSGLNLIKASTWKQNIENKNKNQVTIRRTLMALMILWSILMLATKKGRYFLDKKGNSIFGKSMIVGIVLTLIAFGLFRVSNSLFKRKYEWIDGATNFSDHILAIILFLPFAYLLPFLLYFLYLARKSVMVETTVKNVVSGGPQEIAKAIGGEADVRSVGDNARRMKMKEANLIAETLRAKEEAHKANIDAAKKKIEEEIYKRYSDDKR